MSELVNIVSNGKTYEEAISNAMLVWKKFIDEDAQVYRDRYVAHAQEKRDWYVKEVNAVPSPGAQYVNADVYFELIGTDL